MKRFALVTLAVMLAVNVPAAQDLERQFKAAMNTEMVDGNCKAAIEQYNKVAAGGHRGLAAQALLRMAGCHQKLGDNEAQRIYARIVRDYGDQTEVVAQARAQLTAGTQQPRRGDRIALSGAETTWGDGRVSPDGRYISYVSYAGPKGLNLMLHDLVNRSDRALTDVDWNGGAVYDSTFSPDGKLVAYGWRTYGRPHVEEIRVVAADGPGIPQPRTIYRNDQFSNFAPTDWSRDGKTLAVRATLKDGTVQIALVGLDGSFRSLTTIDGWKAATKIFFSPDGKYLAYDLPLSETDPRRDLYIIAADASRQTPIHDPADDVFVGWTPDGRHLLFASDRNRTVGLWALPVVDGKPAKGSPILVKPDVGGMVSQGLTASGTLYAVKESSSVNLQIAPIDFEHGKLTGPPVAQIYRPQTPQIPAWSSDGKLLAYAARSASDRSYVAIRDLDSNRVRELHPSLVYIPHLQWFPDGRSVLVHGRDIKRRAVAMRIDLETGRESPIVSGVSSRVQLSPDGTKAYYTVNEDGANRGLGTIVEHDLVSGAKREVFRKPGGTGSTHLSPDGKFIAVIRTPSAEGKNSNAPATSTLFVYSVDGGPTREINVPVAVNQYFGVDWLPDGKNVVVAGGSPGRLWVVPVSGTPRALDVDIRNWGPGAGIRIHPNGKQIAFFTGQEAREVWALEGLIPAAK
jgi:Tol biopolymer transport system component